MKLLPWGRVRPGFAIAALALVGLALLALPASPRRLPPSSPSAMKPV